MILSAKKFTMRIKICLVAALLLLAGQLFAQVPSEGFESHTVWKQTIQGVSASVLDQAATDSAGDLWFISDPFNAEPRIARLMHVDANGTVVSQDRLPELIDPPFPKVSSFALATSTSGPLAIVAHHSHTMGRSLYVDGADFVLFDRGKWGVPVKIARSGPEYQTLTALSDGHLLAMGDQSPMVLLKLDLTGKIEWKRRFPSTWVLPSGASTEHGGACVLSSGYLAPWMHLMRLDAEGNVQFQTKFQGRNGIVVHGPSDSCAVLYSTGTSSHNRIRFHLALFDSSLKQKWSMIIPVASYVGGSFHLASLTDGWVVVTDSEAGLGSVFMAKYNFAGDTVWSLTEKSLPRTELLVAAGDSFYLVGDNPEGRESSIVFKGK
jgi:hypothetical protein